jgi:hypothetical protein
MGQDSQVDKKQQSAENSPLSQDPDCFQNRAEKSNDPLKASDILIGESNEKQDAKLQDIKEKNRQDKDCILSRVSREKGDIMTTTGKEDVVSHSPVLEAEAIMKKANEYIMLELQLVERGAGDREALHQVLQYIKNAW